MSAVLKYLLASVFPSSTHHNYVVWDLQSVWATRRLKNRLEFVLPSVVKCYIAALKACKSCQFSKNVWLSWWYCSTLVFIIWNWTLSPSIDGCLCGRPSLEKFWNRPGLNRVLHSPLTESILLALWIKVHCTRFVSESKRPRFEPR